VSDSSDQDARLLADCSAAISQLSQRYDWKLLARDEWSARALQHLSNGSAPSPIAAVLVSYSYALHHACAGQLGAAVQNQGYADLANYLAAAAIQRYPELPPDIVQRALLRTYEQFAECQSPATLLAFAFQHLRSAARDERAVDAFYFQVSPTFLEQIKDDVDIEYQILHDESTAAIIRLFELLAARHPRAADQLAAVRMKFIDGLDDATIAERLKTTIPNVQVLRARGKKRLLKAPELRRLLEREPDAADDDDDDDDDMSDHEVQE
jgi:DNA-directed RNA polymerase specialized sigma24 family protein